MAKMKFYILDLGHLMGDLGWFVAMYRPATLVNQNPPRTWHKIPCTSFLIDHPKAGWILFDTGPNPDARRDLNKNRVPQFIQDTFPLYAKDDELLTARLAKLNLKPSDIGTVVISHLHWDHCGNTDLFQHAKIYVHKEDFTNAMVWTHVTPERNYEFYVAQEFLVPNPRGEGGYAEPVSQGLNWTLIDEDTEIAEGVELITLAGHTPGVLGLVVHLDNFGTIICPSDAIFTPMNLGPPPHPPGIIYDTVAFKESAHKVLKLKDRYNAKILYNHWNESYADYRLVPDYYE